MGVVDTHLKLTSHPKRDKVRAYLHCSNSNSSIQARHTPDSPNVQYKNKHTYAHACHTHAYI
jgi:hypothetical protein